ncbi:MAG TPA: peptidoglycan-binding domain-containing protein [Acidimicrobiales bacterium]
MASSSSSKSSSKSSSTGTVILVLLALFALGSAGGSLGDSDTTTGADTTSDDDFSFAPDGGTTTGGLPACDDVETVPAPGGGTIAVPADSTLGSVTVDCQVGEGSDDEAVVIVQDALSRCNERPVSVDGDYGPETRGAVADLQAASGLAADGVVGPATRQAMRWPGTLPSGAPDCLPSG